MIRELLCGCKYARQRGTVVMVAVCHDHARSNTSSRRLGDTAPALPTRGCESPLQAHHQHPAAALPVGEGAAPSPDFLVLELP